jgi:hypothetical protein
MVVEVCDDGFAVYPEADSAWGVEMLPHVGLQSVLHQILASRGEKLDRVVLKVMNFNRNIIRILVSTELNLIVYGCF